REIDGRVDRPTEGAKLRVVKGGMAFIGTLNSLLLSPAKRFVLCDKESALSALLRPGVHHPAFAAPNPSHKRPCGCLVAAPVFTAVTRVRIPLGSPSFRMAILPLVRDK